jgi:hypothetical protein
MIISENENKTIDANLGLLGSPAKSGSRRKEKANWYPYQDALFL